MFMETKSMSDNNFSLADVLAMSNNKSDNFLQGNGILIILFFLIFGGGLGGWGRNGALASDALTRAELSQGFADNQMLNKLDGISHGICDSTYSLNNTINNGFNALNQTLNNNNIAVLQGFNGVDKGLCQLSYQNQQCCCELKNAIHAEGEMTRALIQNNTLQELRDKIADKDRELLASNFQNSQQSQTSNIINSLRPFPQPAYLTCSPYTSAYNACYCGNNTNLL